MLDIIYSPARPASNTGTSKRSAFLFFKNTTGIQDLTWQAKVIGVMNWGGENEETLRTFLNNKLELDTSTRGIPIFGPETMSQYTGENPYSDMFGDLPSRDMLLRLK